MKNIYFISGLPRSGSTLLCNILAQNPDFRVTGTSGLLDVLFGIRNQWGGLPEFRAMPARESQELKLSVLRGAVKGYFSFLENKDLTAFDKSRGWLAYLEFIEEILDREVKVLVPVRDTRDILASLEKIVRIHPSFQMSEESKDYYEWQTLEGRCNIWARNDGILGLAYNRLKDCCDRGLKNRLLFVDYKNLTSEPRITLERIYDFLEKPGFRHDFNSVDQVIVENDLAAYGIPGLHEIQPRVVYPGPQWPFVLTEELQEKYAKVSFWSQNN